MLLRKLTVLFGLTLVLSGCYRPELIGHARSGDFEFRIICLGNVEYYISGLGMPRDYMAVRLQPNGLPYVCD